MEKKNHGDRSATPKPIEELIAEHELELAAKDQLNAEMDEQLEEIRWVGPESANDGQTQPATDFAVQWRQWGIAVAATSFGQTGARTVEELVDRSVAILQYITNGKP